jgi:hypothetical protein
MNTTSVKILVICSALLGFTERRDGPCTPNSEPWQPANITALSSQGADSIQFVLSTLSFARLIPQRADSQTVCALARKRGFRCHREIEGVYGLSQPLSGDFACVSHLYFVKNKFRCAKAWFNVRDLEALNLHFRMKDSLVTHLGTPTEQHAFVDSTFVQSEAMNALRAEKAQFMVAWHLPRDSALVSIGIHPIEDDNRLVSVWFQYFRLK